MKDNDALRDHLRRLLKWEDAHVGFDRAVEDVPQSAAGIKPDPLPYSLWQLLEHIRLAQWDILDFCRNSDYREMKWPDDYWPASPEPPDAEAWSRSVAQVRADRAELEELVASEDFDPFAAIPHGDGQTYLREVLLVADHTAYHVGEMIAVRRLLGIWK